MIACIVQVWTAQDVVDVALGRREPPDYFVEFKDIRHGPMSYKTAVEEVKRFMAEYIQVFWHDQNSSDSAE